MRARFGLLAALLVPVVLAVAIAGCAAGTAPPTGDPSIRGQITSLSRNGDSLVLLVEAGSNDGTLEYDKASVAVTPDTDVFIRSGDDVSKAGSSADLDEGQTVEVWFEGPVAESYPVQATAGTIVVVSPSGRPD